MVLANGATTLAVAANATTFTLPGTVAVGSSYAVTVQTQPTGRTCSVGSGTGTMPANNVVSVSVTCVANTYTLGGAVSGLSASGLVLANGATTLTVPANATSFSMPGTVAFGSTYNVTVQTQPAGLTCVVANGSGTVAAANITNVAVSCGYSVGGTISGLTSAGLVLSNGGATLTVAANSTTFTMPVAVASGAAYAVTVQTQPAGNSCSIANGSGTVASANVTNIAVTCVNRTFTLGGTISGLTANGLVLANGANTLAVNSGSTTFTLPSSVAFGSAYAVVVQTNPTGLACTVSGGTGTMPANNVTSVTVSCGLGLQPRSFDGGVSIGGYYDPAQNITWLKNNNAAAGGAFDNGKSTTDGRMTWDNAVAWVASVNFGGVSGWRLPRMVDTGAPGCSGPGEFSLTGGTSCGQNVIVTPGSPNSSEMGYLNIVLLGNKSSYNTSGGLNPQPTLTNFGPFPTIPSGYNVVWYTSSAGCPNTPADPRNCRDDAYWTGVQDASNSGSAWKYAFGGGEQVGDSKNVEFFAWAVHDGDVGTTPGVVGTLQPRSFDGGATIGGYYDTAQHITWLKNNNAAAGSIFDDGKSTTDGRMTWNSAMAWVQTLTFGGVTGWRLPTMVDTGSPGCGAQGEFSLTGGTSCGQNVIVTPGSPNSSEMAYLNTVLLGNLSSFNTSGGLNPQPTLTHFAPFPTIPSGYNVVWYTSSAGCPNSPADPRNCRDDAYWTNLQDASNAGSAWKYVFGAGEQGGDSKTVEFFAWAVHDGDIGTP